MLIRVWQGAIFTRLRGIEQGVHTGRFHPSGNGGMAGDGKDYRSGRPGKRDGEEKKWTKLSESSWMPGEQK